MGRKRRPSDPGWPRDGAVISLAGFVALLAFAVAIVVALRASDVIPEAGRATVPPAPLPDEASTSLFATPTPTPAPTPTPTPSPPPPPPRAAFIGDSYTQGGGAASHDHRWTTLTAADLGWVEKNFGRGGTGFVTTNSYLGCGLRYCPTYVEMVAETVAVAPDIVVVAGGQNDFPAFARDPDRVRAAVAETYRSLRVGLPGATIVAVGPSTPWEIDDVARQLDAAVREAAASVGAVYISMLEPNVIDPAHSLGDGHVGNDGHRAIADRIVSVLAD